MKMSGTITLLAPREKVWQALNDADVLQKSIHGAEKVEKKSDRLFTATVRARVGPVSARFQGEITLLDLNPPESCRIEGKGQGGMAGLVQGTAWITLKEENNATHLSYTVEARLRGKLAQLGQRLLDAAAKKMADSFFTSFTQTLTTSQEEAPSSGIPVWIWGPGLVLFILLLLYFTAHPFP